MSAKHSANFKYGAGRPHGAALMIMLVILVIGVAVALIGSLSMSALNNARQETTFSALVQARDSLLGRAVSDDFMPGSLPCPDTNDDGSADLLSGNDCPSYIGRLPWRTLDLPDLRDGSGERLWYVLSPPFRDDNSAQPLNSNTRGTLQIYNADGVTLQTQAGYDAVAVIFSPGSPVGTQARNTIAQQNDAENYLDAANSRDNFSASGPYIAGTKSDSFNDQFLFITTQDLIPLVEQRVAGVVKTALTGYYNNYGYFPWADTIAGPTDYDYSSNEGTNQGWLPENAATTGTNATPNWNTGSPPAWFFANKWNTLIYYSVADAYTHPSTSGALIVNGTIGMRTLFIMPGTPIGTLTRSVNNLTEYMEDGENINGDIKFVTPTSHAKDRDRLYWLPGSTIWQP